MQNYGCFKYKNFRLLVLIHITKVSVSIKSPRPVLPSLFTDFSDCTIDLKCRNAQTKNNYVYFNDASSSWFSHWFAVPGIVVSGIANEQNSFVN